MQLRDIWRLAAFLTLGLLAGWLMNAVPWGLLAAALVYVATLHADLNRLLRWLRQRKAHEPPERPGVFEELTLEIDYLRDRHKKRKKKLSNYLKQFQQATRALPDATVVLDPDGEVRWANATAREALGIRWPDDVGQRLTNIIRLPELRQFVESSDEDNRATLEIPCPTDRERQLSVLMAPYGNDQRILVARDVTELHRANQVRSDFVANVSHELRTPITVFRGYLETLSSQRDACPPEWGAALEEMTVHADRMRSLVEELLLLSSLEAEPQVSNPEPVDVSQLLNEVHAAARELSGDRDHLFSLEVDGGLRVLGHRNELYSAFSNLVFNAVQYTPARGVVRLRWYADDAGAHFVVEDNGIGIAEEHLPRLTERFYRVDASRQRDGYAGGTGLGLAIVKHVLSRHRATLHITSTLDKGSCFSADFPAEVVVAANDPAATGAARGAG